MKKLFLFLFLISLIYPSTSVLALSKSGSGLSSEVVTRKGRIDGISINDKWITFNGTSTSSKVRSTILNALKIRNKEEIITYRVNILDTTKIETNDKKPILLEELQIGDYAAVTGRVINEATNKIDEYKTEKVFLIEASYINVNNRRGVIEAISKAFSKYFQTGGLISVTNKSSIITNPDGTISLQPYDNTAERQGKCVGYGKPIVENRESAPVQPQVCCDGLKEYEALSVKFEEKPTVNIQGYVYTVKAYCYGLDGIPSDITGKVFEKDDCISEGEPLLIGSILAPKVIQNCCEGLVECIASDYKAFPQPTGSEVISLNGFSYIVKGYCRKECPKSYSGWSLLPFLPDMNNISIGVGKCYKDSDCCTAQNPLCNQVCIDGKCVYRDPSDVGFLLGCNKDSDCFYDGEGCILKAGGYEFNMLDWKLMNDPRGCVCNTNTRKCVLVENKNAPSIDGCNPNIKCDDEVVFVCGKDGKTYNNPCEAIRCNTTVACAGKCPCRTTPSIPSMPVIPSPHPGKCDVEDDCELCGDECFEKTMLQQLKSTGKVCDQSNSQLKCVCEQGMCLAMPDIYDPDQPCEDIVELVCGLDGKTYQNKCEASKANTSVKCLGACPCNDQIPSITCPSIYTPVCGTNNKTYKNSCYAQQAQVMVKCNQACPCPVDSVVPPPSDEPDLLPTPALPVQLKEVNIDGFCGLQTETECNASSDISECMVASGHGHLCQAKKDGNIITTGEFRDCYFPQPNVNCGCYAGKCQWYGVPNAQNQALTPLIDSSDSLTIDPSGGIVVQSITY